MRNEVITFLSDESIRPEGQYNQALSFYMRSENANPGVVRYHNVSGYSPQRLSELVYDLKQSYGIADADLVKKAPKVVQLTKKQDPRFKVPEWSTGATGNRERKEYCKVNDIAFESGKNDDLDVVIQNFLDTENAKLLEAPTLSAIQREATAKETAFTKVVKWMNEGNTVTPEMKAEIFAGIDITEDEQDKMIEKAANNVLGDADKKNELLKVLAKLKFRKEPITEKFKEEIKKEFELKDEEMDDFLLKVEGVTNAVDYAADKVLNKTEETPESEKKE